MDSREETARPGIRGNADQPFQEGGEANRINIELRN